ncbi:MAG TPA: HDOD domain-containing protein [Steroidobacteraceae bacterium]|nr:HDOD domain-containing protein [Steroidobacteraceae bacterium]
MDSSCGSAESAGTEHILRAASSLGLLGAKAHSAIAVVGRLCDPEINMGEVASLIEPHPALCARVLRIANSPYYGHKRSVSTIKQAVYLLGLDSVRGIAAAACIDRALPRSQSGGIDLAAILRHSIATAVAAELLADEMFFERSSEAFVAGVLHNLGVVIQASVDAPGLQALIAARRADPAGDLRALEALHVSIHHERCAELIFKEWQLPPQLVHATGYHHRPRQAPAEHRRLAAVVCAAGKLALACGYTFSLEPVPTPLDEHLRNDLELTESDVEELAARLSPKIAEMQAAMTG